MAKRASCWKNEVNGKYRYQPSDSGMGAWSTTQPSYTDLVIQSTTDINFRIVSRKIRAKDGADRYVKVQNFRYDEAGDPYKLITRYYKPTVGWKANNGSKGNYSSQFTSADNKFTIECWDSKHCSFAIEQATQLTWSLFTDSTGYSGDTSSGPGGDLEGGGGLWSDLNSVTLDNS